MSNDLTQRQIEVLVCVADFIHGNGKAPTLREIGAMLGIGSPNGVFCHLHALANKGVLLLAEEARSRDIKLTERGWAVAGYTRCPHCQALVEPGKKVA